MIKKLIYATLVGTVVSFLLGWLIYGVVLDSFMKSQTTEYTGLMREMDGTFIILILLSNLMMSFFIAFIFQRWAKFETFFMGLTAGMMIGFFFAVSYDLYMLAAMNLFKAGGAIVDIIASTILTGIIGGVIAWVLGFKSKAVPAQ